MPVNNDAASRALLQAIQSGNLANATLALTQSADVNYSVLPPLIVAAQKESLEFVKFLAERGANVNASLADSTTALMLASKAGNLPITEYLLSKGAKSDLPDQLSQTALYFAVANNRENIVIKLLEFKANPNLGLSNGMTPLYLAAAHGLASIVARLLTAGANPNIQIKPSLQTIKLEQSGLMQNPEIGETPLFRAAASGQVEVVECLLKANANVKLQTHNKQNPLHYAMMRTPNLEVVQHLVRAGADVNACDKYKYSVLHFAIDKGDLAIVKYLVEEAKAKINRVDPEYSHFTFAMFKKKLDIAKYLLTKVTEVDPRNIDFAIEYGEAEAAMLDNLLLRVKQETENYLIIVDNCVKRVKQIMGAQSTIKTDKPNFDKDSLTTTSLLTYVCIFIIDKLEPIFIIKNHRSTTLAEKLIEFGGSLIFISAEVGKNFLINELKSKLISFKAHFATSSQSIACLDTILNLPYLRMAETMIMKPGVTEIHAEAVFGSVNEPQPFAPVFNDYEKVLNTLNKQLIRDSPEVNFEGASKILVSYAYQNLLMQGTASTAEKNQLAEVFKNFPTQKAVTVMQKLLKKVEEILARDKNHQDFINLKKQIVNFFQQVKENEQRDKEQAQLKEKALLTAQAALIFDWQPINTHIQAQQNEIAALKQSHTDKRQLLQKEWQEAIEKLQPINRRFTIQIDLAALLANEKPSRKGLSASEQAIRTLLNLPAHLALGTAIDNGDCFFDALAQALNIQPTQQHTVKSLRQICHRHYTNPLYTSSVNVLHKKDYSVPEKAPDYHEIQFTAPEAELNGKAPIWGRPHVEGKILCNALNLPAIHLIELLINPENKQLVPNSFLMTREGKRSIAENTFSPHIPILVVEQNDLHFVPVLPMAAVQVEQPALATEKLLTVINEKLSAYQQQSDIAQNTWDQLVRYRNCVIEIQSYEQQLQSAEQLIQTRQQTLALQEQVWQQRIAAIQHRQQTQTEFTPEEKSQLSTFPAELNKLHAEQKATLNAINNIQQEAKQKLSELQPILKNLPYFVQFTTIPVRVTTEKETHTISKSARTASPLVTPAMPATSFVPAAAAPANRKSQTEVASVLPADITVEQYYPDTLPLTVLQSRAVFNKRNFDKIIPTSKHLESLRIASRNIPSAPMQLIICLPFLVSLLDNVLSCLSSQSSQRSNCNSLRNFFAHGFYYIMKQQSDEIIMMSLSFIDKWLTLPCIHTANSNVSQLPPELENVVAELSNNLHNSLLQVLRVTGNYSENISLPAIIGRLLNQKPDPIRYFKQLIHYFYETASNAHLQLHPLKTVLQSTNASNGSQQTPLHLLSGFIFLFGEAVQQIANNSNYQQFLPQLVAYYQDKNIFVLQTLWDQAKQQRNRTSHGAFLSLSTNRQLLLDLITLLELRGQALDLLHILETLHF